MLNQLLSVYKVIEKNDLPNFSHELGNPTSFLVETPSIALKRNVLDEISDLSNNMVPSSARSIIVLRLYFSAQYAEWNSSQRSRRSACVGSTQDTIPDKSYNLVEMKFLDQTGRDIETPQGGSFLHCKVVNDWIVSKGKSTKRHVFSGLKNPSQRGVNHYSDQEMFV